MGVKISNLPANALPYTGSEKIPLVQSGETRAGTLSSLANYFVSDSELAALSGNWQNTYTTFSSTSANYAVKNANNNFTSTQTFLSSGIFIGTVPIYTRPDSFFVGTSAGYDATNASDSNFLGANAGFNATNAYNSNFLGANAGSNATNASESNFLGTNAGFYATNVSESNFIGFRAGSNAANAYNSNFLGRYAGSNATNANNSIFIGTSAGFNATYANNSIFIGANSGASLSGCIALGIEAVPTMRNQLVLGSAAVPLSTTDSGNSLVIRINGTMKKITLLSV